MCLKTQTCIHLKTLSLFQIQPSLVFHHLSWDTHTFQFFFGFVIGAAPCIYKHSSLAPIDLTNPTFYWDSAVDTLQSPWNYSLTEFRIIGEEFQHLPINNFWEVINVD